MDRSGYSLARLVMAAANARRLQARVSAM